MQFTLVGFSQDAGSRVFQFKGIAADRTRAVFSVRADLSMIRRYGILMQDLPLLCRGLLDRRDECEEKRTLTFTEDEMCIYAKDRAAARDAAKQKRKRPQAPNGLSGVAWRTQQ